MGIIPALLISIPLWLIAVTLKDILETFKNK
jgi:hypothetical protein